MKKLKPYIFIAGFIIVAGIVIVGVLHFSNRFLTNDDKTIQAGTAQCSKPGITHTVVVQNNTASPKHTDGVLCDKLTIINKDKEVRLMAFGEHENHQAYDGVTERQLSEGQSFTVTLNKTGTFEFHDHIGDIVQGDFTVTQ